MKKAGLEPVWMIFMNNEAGFNRKNTIENWSIQTDPGKHYAGGSSERSTECRHQD
jgi:hypothetical protein